MKKVITILAILVVLTSAVFAETHKLKIQATSTEVHPVFQMTIGSVTTNTDNSKYGTESNTSLDKTDVVAKTFNFEDGGKVKVTVTIQNAAKTQQNYLLTFGGGVFQVNRNSVASDANTDDDNLPATPTIAFVTKTGTGYSSSQTENDGEGVVDFNGTKCTAGAEIAGATYTYAADQTIDPGTYSADIELVITTTT